MMPKGRGKGAVRLVGLLSALGLLLGLLAGAEMWRSYGETTDAAERSMAGFVRLLAEQTERTIQAVDFTLIGMRDALQVAPGLPPNDPTYRAALKERLKSLPFVRALFVIGAEGFITHDTDYPSTPVVSLEDRPYFRAHRDDIELGLHIGRPLQSRSVGVWFVSVSRRINHSDGSFAGVVVAAIEPHYLKRFYKGLSIGEGDFTTLLLKDGTLLARAPDHKGMIGKSVPLNLARNADKGVAWGTSPIDGVSRIIGFQVLAGAPLIVTAGRSVSTIYDAWRNHAAVVGGGAFVVWLLTSGLALISHQHGHRSQLEQARRAQSQRLETMGRIAGGIAHDLGNTIKIARTTFTLLKPSLASQGDAIALVEEADRSLKSAFDIIDRLLAFARRQVLSPRPTDLADLIAGFAPILRQAAGPQIELALDLTKPLVCSVDPIHLESALLNLVLNSKDAIADGGRIVVELREVQAPRRRYRVPRLASAKRLWAEITIRDDGVGMPRDVLDRAFEPFFTTKSNGSGLGLSQVLGFVHQSAGEVRLQSREGRGTTVRLLFPTVSTPIASTLRAPELPASAA
jgi:two-component system NtrC family sensor kinase